MKKDNLTELGLTEEVAAKVIQLVRKELKEYIPKQRFDEINDRKKELTKQVALQKEIINELAFMKSENVKLEKIVNELWKSFTLARTEQEEILKKGMAQIAMSKELAEE